MVNHSDKVNIITKVYDDKINTNFDSIVNHFGSDGVLLKNFKKACHRVFTLKTDFTQFALIYSNL